jgi:hypothetical protein
LGKTGLKGTELLEFAKQAVNLDREVRAQERSAQIESDRLDFERREADLKLRLDEEEINRKQRESEHERKVAEEKMRLEHELVVLRERQSFEDRLETCRS